MADTGSSIFNKAATERLRSPEDLDRYVRATSPSAWVILGAVVALLVGLLCWGVFGAVSTSVSGAGVRIDDQVLCYLTAEEVARVKVGDDAMVAGQRLSVADISELPLSRDEARATLGSDYLAQTLLEDDWAYVVSFEGDFGDLDGGVPLPVDITTERVSPISLVLG